MIRLIVLLLTLALAQPAAAYSYAAAGKEPLIDGREAILAALADNNTDQARAALQAIDEELVYLAEHHGLDLRTSLNKAVVQNASQQVQQLLNRAFATEIQRRLDGAAKNIDDYQTAKVLVVKSKRFLDLLLPHLNDTDRQQADQALRGCLEAIGNPGVFGVGAKPADPAAFAQHREQLDQVLGAL